MNRIKKLLTLTVLSALCLTTIQPALASSVVTAPGQASSSAVLTTDATLIDVTVPTSVLIYITSSGEVLTPDNMPITNNSIAPVVVTNLAITTEDGWTLDAYSTDYSKFKLGHKNYSLQINGQDPSAGALAFDTPINGSESLNLALLAGVAPQKTAVNGIKIGSMVVTVDWCTDAVSYPAGYVLATDSDFDGDSDGFFSYIGAADRVIIPDTIKGIPVTSYSYMFSMSDVKGVISTNPNITNMSNMFMDISSTALELDLNTSNVTNMYAMFASCAATTLDLSGFDTSKVTNMERMFVSSKAAALNLSSFNTAKVTNMIAMFKDSAAVTLNLNGFNTSQVTSMSEMFKGSKATELNLISFNTSNVTNMASMFSNTAATTLNLSSFDVSKVTNMLAMFSGSKATVLDLSSFDLVGTPNTNNMFLSAVATTGYARNAGYASTFNATSGKPAGLTFIVK